MSEQGRVLRESGMWWKGSKYGRGRGTEEVDIWRDRWGLVTESRSTVMRNKKKVILFGAKGKVYSSYHGVNNIKIQI